MSDPILETLRREIDRVDRELIACIARRLTLSAEIGARKQATSESVYQPQRAAAVQENYVRLGTALGLRGEFMQDVFRAIHAESCKIQRDRLNRL
ncbi:chorismate mutase [Alicyclobacillus sacchari]|uniref:Chorismate mutase n=1 Tax=Alicyclobacillus sacchari TaxID=392010 RepID=A0A4V3HE86_9BACL|nr:chorismate mutase [Alicyclobacillus sacchari]TDY45205.1 chorismate mutase [Alicyclobacillus sacchari]